MNALKTILLVVLFTVVLAVVAQAADLPTMEARSGPLPRPNCNADFMTWLNASPSACPSV